ncbi:hypothetical protein NBRC116592_27070 [Colwellia sp. KU-HH00111]|uniref:Ig-like domain-containing protein n=1 Tax=Colwellia sp. KU-HH00111 TaxID=3127652 RepID=UPI003103D8FB
MELLRHASFTLLFIILTTLVGCGGGDGNLTGDTGGTDQNIREVTTVNLFASSQQLPSSGADEIILTAIVKDSNNQLVSGATVAFSSTSGSIQATNNLTGDDGKATALLKTEGEPENRVITVSAVSETIADTVDIAVVGTSISLTGSSALAINDDNSFVIKVLDSDNNAIAKTTVDISLSNSAISGNVASITIPETVETDFNGQAIVKVNGSTGGSNTITASALGASISQNVTVQADSFLFSQFTNGNGVNVNPSSSPELPDVLLSDTATITLTWLRSGEPVPDGTAVSFTATRGVLAANSGTVSNGKVSATVTSSNAGQSIVTFTGVDGSIELNNQVQFEFVAETANRIIAQASPNSIGPNGEISIISTTVKDINGNLVKNKTVDFELTDVNGGSIFPATAVTDSNGYASTTYTSNAVSAQDGIEIKATVRDKPTVNDTVTLTVADRELFIAIGTGNEVEETDDGTTYTKKFVAFVTDVDSNPVTNQKLTISAVPHRFYKGQWVQMYKDTAKEKFISWVTAGLVRSDLGRAPAIPGDWDPVHACINEDTDIDGVLDEDEDTNNDGRLTPGNVLSSLAAVSTDGEETATVEAVTDSEGKIVIDLVYPQSFGHWVDVNIIVSGSVKGTESSAKTTFTLPVAASDVQSEFISPPTANVGAKGPFGLLPDCTTTQ